MPVKAEVTPILDMLAAVEVPLTQQTPQSLRDGYAALSGMGTVEDVAAVEDRTIPGPGGELPIRIYRPSEPASSPSHSPANGDGAGAPVLVYFHGGGWVIGSLDTHDNVCRSLTNAAGLVVVSVDYRLAPEHRFPAAFDDALAAVRWVADHAGELGVDAGRLAVGGDSAGGNLAALACQQLRARPAIRFQLLIYPLLDARFGTASMEQNAEGYFLTREVLFWFREHYLDGAAAADPRVSPACVPDGELADLPPGLVITAEYDPLRDEGEAYGQRCRAAGVDMTVTRYDGMIHGFFSMADWLPDGRSAIDQAASALRTVLA